MIDCTIKKVERLYRLKLKKDNKDNQWHLQLITLTKFFKLQKELSNRAINFYVFSTSASETDFTEGMNSLFFFLFFYL